MRILKLLNNNYLSIILLTFFIAFNANAENEPVDIAHDPPLPINVDGEPCLQTPAIIEFHPKQLWLRGSKDVSWDVS